MVIDDDVLKGKEFSYLCKYCCFGSCSSSNPRPALYEGVLKIREELLATGSIIRPPPPPEASVPTESNPVRAHPLPPSPTTPPPSKRQKTTADSGTTATTTASSPIARHHTER